MIPAALASQLENGIADFLRMSFWSSTPGMEGVIERLIGAPGGILKGPYVSASLPFQQGSADEFFPEVPLGFPAHLHQEQAFRRLSGKRPRSTLIATGTGSGKTESFLWPILDHCRQHVGTPGIKAILIYPMNALATDQAGRIAKAIHANPALNGAVRAGLYIGESPGERRHAHKTMGPDYVITNRKTLQLSPPDILLTNYKMLDYLLIRPGDQELWQHNLSGALRFLIVDELHTFDGAQGTDLACLLRRLKSRLAVEPGKLCCVGTSATLGGGGDAAGTLRHYAEDIFGEPFDEDAVVREQRLTPMAFFADHLIEFSGAVASDDREQLEPSRYPTPQAFVLAQQPLWFDEPLTAEPWSATWRVELGAQLLRHGMLRNLITLLAAGPVDIEQLVEGIGRASRKLRDDKELAHLALVSFLSLISEARSWLPESPQAKAAREDSDTERRTRPFLEVRLQVWQRELRRMVADLAPAPTLRFSDDLTDVQRNQHLPLIHCRDCGAMGWATHQSRDKPDLYRTSLQRFYRGFFGNDPQVRFLWPAAAAPTGGSWHGALRFPLERESLVRVRDEDFDDESVVHVVVSDSLITEKGTQKLSRDCPFCAARGSLTLLGFRAPTLTGVYIDQLFASTFNDDKKLLTFSDSVQDAAHRAGFFGARTWRFNLRVALQKVVVESEGISLEELPAAFVKRWRGPSTLSDVEYVTTFLAPSMEWFSEYELLQETGEVPEGSNLLGNVDRRIAFEIFTEFGHQSRIGRSLSRTGSATVWVDAATLDAATDTLLPQLQNEVGGLRELDRTTLRSFLIGALHHLLERGGIRHRELPDDFVTTGGRDTYVFKRNHHLPAFGRSSRMPALLTDDVRSPRFDAVLHKSTGQSWYERWVARCFGNVSTLIGSSSEVWSVVLPVLTEQKLLSRDDGKHGRVWGIMPAALRVSSATKRLRCRACGHWQVVAACEMPAWDSVPCLSARCDGRYLVDDASPQDYFGRLYNQGEVERVFASEHTGLLSRGVREVVEQEFKTEPADRKPWYPNLLSCTPTLEMGIDIGTLSSAILCSVPPAQANYLQRIGRAGRRDGNSLLLTIAAARPHDLYFYAEPLEMIAGKVNPPGVFLNASAVLERQLAAFCFDQWNAQGVPKDAIPGQLTKIFDQLDDAGTGRFPHNWLDFVRGRDDEILEAFFGLFGDRVSEDSRKHLHGFLMGDREDEGSLGWKVLDVLRGERKQRDSLRSQAKKVKAVHDTLKAAKAKNKDHDVELGELRREKDALDRLVKQIQGTAVLQFLTDNGLLPNYAFPESPIRLRSVIWRKKQHKSEKDKSAYETRTYEYARPAMAAISELAPENRFFAGGRHVTINQIDVATASVETWRFCDQCAYSARIDVAGDLTKDCPSCGSHVWGEDSQKGQLLKLEQVFANTSDRDSRIRDDQEERQPRHYNSRMLMSFNKKDRDGAWHIDEKAVPFAFEYLRRARFREINFGEFSDNGSKFSISGRDEVRQGFAICRHCGKVQPKPPKSDKLPPPKPEHTLWCPARKKGPDAKDYQVAVFLYREFYSEAIRLLLPLSEIGTDTQLNSFLAAFQLGLRDKYGGRVDHLQTLVYSEPEGDGYLRRQYLALYDTVPGGTGYLKDFTRDATDSEELHPLLDILQRALDRMTSCTCFHDPDLDGCYRCLFAYRNSRDMSETSSSVAVDLYKRILAHADQLTPIAALSDVSVSGLMDSVLEARFVEALRRLGTETRSVHVEKAIVRNKPGYRVTVDGEVWNIEQQLELGADQGITPGVSIDFVFHPGNTDAGRKPIAVFLDGFQFHCDRISFDMLQRMTLLTSGLYDVWSFSWYDIDEAFHTDVKPAPFLVHPEPPVLKAALGKLGFGAAASVFEARVIDSFVDSLAGGESRIDWPGLACATLIAQMKRPDEVNAKQWLDEVRHRAPEAARAWFDEVDDSWFFVQRPPTVDTPFGLWAAAPAEALRAPVDASRFRLLVWLDDSAKELNTAEFREPWRGYLHAFQYLRGLPHGWFVATRGDLDYQPLSQARLGAGRAESASEASWADLDVEPPFAALVEALAGCGIPLPDVGIDLPDARGHTSGLEGELVWETERCAVVESTQDGERPVSPDWHVFERVQLLADVAPLVAALRRTQDTSTLSASAERLWPDLDVGGANEQSDTQILRSLANGWSAHRLGGAEGKQVVFRKAQQVRVSRIDDRYVAELASLGLRAHGTDLKAASEALAAQLASDGQWAMRARAHMLGADQRQRKQNLLAMIDVVASGLIERTSDTIWVFGQICTGTDHLTLDAGAAGLFPIPDHLISNEVTVDSWWFASVATEPTGSPHGPILELRATTKQDVARLLGKWKKRGGPDE